MEASPTGGAPMLVGACSVRVRGHLQASDGEPFVDYLPSAVAQRFGHVGLRVDLAPLDKLKAGLSTVHEFDREDAQLP